MSNVITIEPIVDVQKIRTASDRVLLEYLLDFDHNLDDRIHWFGEVSKILSTPHQRTTSHKIQNIFYAKSKFTSIERIHVEDLARKKLTENPQDNVIQFSFHLRGRG